MAEAVLRPIAALAQELAAGKTTSRKLVEAALARIADAGGEGGRVFTKVHAQGALPAASSCASAAIGRRTTSAMGLRFAG